MNFSLKVNYFIFSILCSFLFCEAKDWLCKVINWNRSVHEYICKRTNDTIDDKFESENCHSLSDAFNSPPNHPEVTELTIRHCDFHPIASCLNVYGNVISLDISNSEYESLDSFNLNHNFLIKLNASHNKIEKIPKLFFANIPEILEVDFSHNSLFHIDSVTFESANKLKTIHLSHSDVRSIPINCFEHLNYLEYIDLSSNRITNVNAPFIFLTYRKLKILHLESNPIEFKSDMPLIPFAASVYLSWNRLRIIKTDKLDRTFRIIPNSPNEGYFRTSPKNTELHCSQNSFENVLYFHVRRNQIENIHDFFQCFGSSSTLRSLDLSGNPVWSLDSTEFSRFPMLEFLYLNETYLGSFDFDVLKHQPNLNELDISGNGLKTLESIQLLKSFESLLVFNIADNELENISEIVNSLSSSINELYLSGNFVGNNINRFNIGKFENLTRIELRNTSLQFADVNPFELNTKLKLLDISRNNMKMTNFTMMANSLNKLEYFYATGCQMENASDVIKLLGPELLEIDLSENHLDELKTSTFRSTKLSHINLAEMDMIRFEMDSKLQFLKSMVVPFNRLTMLTFTNSITMDLLREIDIEGNDFTELPNFNKSILPKLYHLNIAKNNFPCKYLVDLLNQTKNEWPYLLQVGDPYMQKHGDCHPNGTQTVKNYRTKATNASSFNRFYTAKFVVPLLLLVIFFAGIGFMFCWRSLKNTNANDFEGPTVIFRGRNIESTVVEALQARALPDLPHEEHIYEDIGPPTVDDQYNCLNFIGQPQQNNRNEGRYQTVASELDTQVE